MASGTLDVGEEAPIDPVAHQDIDGDNIGPLHPQRNDRVMTSFPRTAVMGGRPYRAEHQDGDDWTANADPIPCNHANHSRPIGVRYTLRVLVETSL